ncbi:MAG: hypothetical protein Q9214_007902, partial [Letrouitia sp. 1 TL-2023]
MLSYFGSADPKKLVGKIPPKLKLLMVSLSVILAIDVGVARTIGIISAYRAPLQIYAPLQNVKYAHSEEN